MPLDSPSLCCRPITSVRAVERTAQGGPRRPAVPIPVGSVDTYSYNTSPHDRSTPGRRRSSGVWSHGVRLFCASACAGDIHTPHLDPILTWGLWPQASKPPAADVDAHTDRHARRVSSARWNSRHMHHAEGHGTAHSSTSGAANSISAEVKAPPLGAGTLSAWHPSLAHFPSLCSASSPVVHGARSCSRARCLRRQSW